MEETATVIKEGNSEGRFLRPLRRDSGQRPRDTDETNEGSRKGVEILEGK